MHSLSHLDDFFGAMNAIKLWDDNRGARDQSHVLECRTCYLRCQYLNDVLVAIYVPMPGYVAEVALQFGSAIATKENWKFARHVSSYLIDTNTYVLQLAADDRELYGDLTVVWRLPGDPQIDEEAGAKSRIECHLLDGITDAVASLRWRWRSSSLNFVQKPCRWR